MTHRFVVLSDTHFIEPQRAAEGKAWWNRLLETRCAEIGASLVRTINRLQPEFVLHCGDFTGHGDLASYEFGLQIMNGLDSPWYVVPGNHDSWIPGVRAAMAARCQQAGDDCFFVRDLAGLRFIFLDVVYWTSATGHTSPCADQQLYDSGKILGIGPSPQELAWLQQQLDTADRPVVIVSHAPLGYKPAYPIATLPRGQPTRRPLTSMTDVMDDVLQRQSMRDLIRRCPRIKAAFAGHWHLSDLLREDGLTFCQTAALREYPFEFRLVTVDGGRLSVSTHGLDDESFARDSYVQEWGNRWIAGTASDRDFEVALG